MEEDGLDPLLPSPTPLLDRAFISGLGDLRREGGTWGSTPPPIKRGEDAEVVPFLGSPGGLGDQDFPNKAIGLSYIP